MTAASWNPLRATRDNLRILRWSAVSAFADFSAMYRPSTWVFGWLVRMLAQVSFFALIGRLLDDPDATRFLLIGNATYVAASVAMFVVQSSSWERLAGTLPLLIASPASMFTVFAGRSVQWLADGLAVGTISLLAVGALFGVDLPWPQTLLFVPLVLVVQLATYAFGLALAAVVLRFMDVRNIVANIGHLSLMVLCGVQVPADYWPAPVQVVTDLLPVKHGLLAIRMVLDGEDGWLPLIALEAVVALGWLIVAALLFRHLGESGRRDGSIEFAD